MTRYAHASNKLLGIQIDAAINPGIIAMFVTSDLYCLETAAFKMRAEFALLCLGHMRNSFCSQSYFAPLHCSAREVCETVDSRCKNLELCCLV